MDTFCKWLESASPDKVLLKQVERYLNQLHSNGSDEETAVRMASKAFVDDILNLGGPRTKTELDVSLGNTPPDLRRGVINFIRNYSRLLWRPETFEG